MLITKRQFLYSTLALASTATLVGISLPTIAATAEDLHKDSHQALENLYTTQPFSSTISK